MSGTTVHVVIGGRHETGVIAVMRDPAEAEELAAKLVPPGYVETVDLDEPTDFGADELGL